MRGLLVSMVPSVHGAVALLDCFGTVLRRQEGVFYLRAAMPKKRLGLLGLLLLGEHAADILAAALDAPTTLASLERPGAALVADRNVTWDDQSSLSETAPPAPRPNWRDSNGVERRRSSIWRLNSDGSSV